MRAGLIRLPHRSATSKSFAAAGRSFSAKQFRCETRRTALPAACPSWIASVESDRPPRQWRGPTGSSMSSACRPDRVFVRGHLLRARSAPGLDAEMLEKSGSPNMPIARLERRGLVDQEFRHPAGDIRREFRSPRLGGKSAIPRGRTGQGRTASGFFAPASLATPCPLSRRDNALPSPACWRLAPRPVETT